jgi:hypothetical protein
VGLLFQVPRVAVSVLPSSTVPEIVGGLALTGFASVAATPAAARIANTTAETAAHCANLACTNLPLHLPAIRSIPFRLLDLLGLPPHETRNALQKERLQNFD